MRACEARGREGMDGHVRAFPPTDRAASERAKFSTDRAELAKDCAAAAAAAALRPDVEREKLHAADGRGRKEGGAESTKN